jgi:hypothetical protein
MRKTYWIEINTTEKVKGYKINGYSYSVISKNYYTWAVKCINGRRKCISRIYNKRSYCINDAKAFANATGLEIRCKNT